MEPQHCIACSGVDIASQSKAYAASNIVTTASKMGRANRIKANLAVSGGGVKASGG